MAIEWLKSFGFDKLLLIVDMYIHFVHFYDISAIYCNKCINTKLIYVMNIHEVVEMCLCLQLSQ